MAKPNGNGNGHKLAVCKPAPVGRPTKLTPEVQAAVVRAIEEGCTYKLAAMHAEISLRVFYDWLEFGAEEKAGPHRDFLHAVKRAEANCALTALEAVRGGVENWQSRAWLLERRYRDDYGRTVVEHEGTVKHEHDLGPGIKELLVRLRAMRDRGTIDAVSG